MNYLRRIFKNFIGKCIEKIESYEYRKYDFDENDISKKIVESVDLNDVEVKTDSGYHTVSTVHMTQPYKVYEIHTEHGYRLECADNHIVYTWGFMLVFVKDLYIGDYILTENGWDRITYYYKAPYRLMMYDMTVDSDDHRYYTNGVLSHNTTTIASFITWMIVFHAGRCVLVAANKESTVKEIIRKIMEFFKNLPFFLKPGTENFGALSLTLDNGSRIISTATTKSASISFTIHLVLFDEFAHIPENIVDSFWRSVYPTLSSSRVSQCIITSTPNGTANKFYEIWSKSLEGKNSFKHLRTDYYEFPGRDTKWAEIERANIGEAEFAQEYELQFNVMSKMLIKAEDLIFMDGVKKKYVNKVILSSSRFLNDPNLVWHPGFDPNNIDDDEKFVLLVDLAEGNGVEGKVIKNKEREPDFNSILIFRLRFNSSANMRKYSGTSCCIKDAYRFIQVGRYSCNTEDEEYCGKIASALAFDLFECDRKDNVRMLVEMNFNGKSFLMSYAMHPRYVEESVQCTYHTAPIAGEPDKRRRHKGFKMNSTKEGFCLKGAKMMSKRRIIVTDADTVEQIKSFGYVKQKLKGIGVHDDLSLPAFNHIPRMLDDATFIEWITDILDETKNTEEKYRINEMIEMWAMDNPEISDDEFDEMYDLNNKRSQTSDYYNEWDYGNGTGYGDGFSQYNTPNPYLSSGPVSGNPYSQQSYGYPGLPGIL